MSFASSMLSAKRPAGLGDFSLPRRERYFPSPADWRDEVLYFLLPDRFSDGQEQTRSLLDSGNRAAARPSIHGAAWRWDRWAESGGDRWQGGTLAGIRSQLPYLKRLGVSAIWIAPVFRQRRHLDTFHGYGIQDFLDVDPHFGTRQDLVDLVAAAHAEGLRIILDIIFNHSGANWVYPERFLGRDFGYWGPGEIIAWSRILDDEEMLCVVNGHGTAARGADVIVDANLNRDPSGTDRPLTVVLNTQQAASSDPATYGGPHALGSKVPVQRHSSGTAFVETRDIAPSEVIALANHP